MRTRLGTQECLGHSVSVMPGSECRACGAKTCCIIELVQCLIMSLCLKVRGHVISVTDSQQLGSQQSFLPLLILLMACVSLLEL